MYIQPEALLEQYEVLVHQITRGRGAFICDTDQGMLLLTPFRGSKERALFIIDALRELNRNGYAVEQVWFTKDGEPFTEDETGTRYWLKTYVSGSECAVGREGELVQAVSQLAKLHAVMAKSTIPVPEFMKNDRNDPKNQYERHYKELVKLKNYIKTRKTKNEFEQSFQNWYPYYIADAQKTLELLKTGDTESGYQLCHGAFNQHNVVKTPEGFRIIHFENMSYHLTVSDLATFMRKMLEKNEWSISLGMTMLEAYEKERPLGKNERRALYLLLLFPEKFWKIANHYANSHKAWVSTRDIEKLKKMTDQEAARRTFLENLFSIV